MLDRTDYESWSQRIRLYCRGKENRVYILQSIDQGPFQLGVTRDTLENDSCRCRVTKMCTSRSTQDIYKLINHNIEAKAIWDNVKMLLAGSELTKEDRESQLYDEFERFKMLPGENINEYYNQNQRNFARGNGVAGFEGTQNRAGNANAGQVKNLNHVLLQSMRLGHYALELHSDEGAVLDEEELLFLVGEQPNTFDADVDNQPVRDLARNEDNIFQADECDDFDSDVDDEPTAQSIFMANLSSVGPTYLQASSSDASILSESTVIDSNNADMGNSNVIPYEHYLTTNDVSIVPSCASFALNTAYVLIDNNVHTPNEPSSKKKGRRAKGQCNAPTCPTTCDCVSSYVGLYVITQLFWDFEKTCKKRIIPIGITEGERGFEQTKRCYLTEVIPFFNLLKEYFKGIQKSLVTEVRAMKAVFENLEAEVDQNKTDLRSGEIKQKNLLITNENLVVECLSKDVFYTATDSVLNVSRFFDMHDAFTSAQKRIAYLESENFNLRYKIQNDDHDSMIKHFSKLEVEHFNLQLKYQNLKERFGNKNPVTSSDAPSFDSLFVIGKLNEQIQSQANTIRKLKEKI
ncbi:hypothetical protein Tco_1159109 [Tanacetum coccineum]